MPSRRDNMPMHITYSMKYSISSIARSSTIPTNSSLHSSTTILLFSGKAAKRWLPRCWKYRTFSKIASSNILQRLWCSTKTQLNKALGKVWISSLQYTSKTSQCLPNTKKISTHLFFIATNLWWKPRKKYPKIWSALSSSKKSRSKYISELLSMKMR